MYQESTPVDSVTVQTAKDQRLKHWNKLILTRMKQKATMMVKSLHEFFFFFFLFHIFTTFLSKNI